MHMKSTRPVMTSVSASGPPRNGTCTAWKPPLRRRRSAAQCVALPTPAEAKVSERALAAAASSASVLMFFEGAITTTFGTLPNEATAEKSFAVS